MGIVFYIDIHKSKKAQVSAALQKLRGFLNASEPELVYFLQNMWNSQGKAITYKELREAIMSGGLDQQIIYDWMQDYSKFVIDHLKPSWESAMTEATEQLSKKYPLYSFDPSTEGVKSWIDTKAASFVTNSTQEQINAINAVVGRASLMQDMTVDGLARAIRPMVGLTKPQAVANLNYYEKMIKSGLSEKQALERSVRYSARQSRYRGYNIARTELAFAYNKGQHEGIKQAIDKGYMGAVEKVWCTADDERTCEICGGLEGKRIALDDDFDFKTKLQAANPGIRQTPPAHPSCRCTVLYEEISPPIFDHIEESEPEAQEPGVTIPDSANLPKETHLNYLGPSSMGGTSESYIYEDSMGDQYLFKVAQDKGTTNTAMFRAYIQEAGYKVQYIVDPDTAVPVQVMTMYGKQGALQKIIKTGKDNPIMDFQNYGKALSSSDISQLQKEHVTDWLLGNFDSHAKNFLYDKSGKLIGVDKEQGLKYLGAKHSQKMSLTYHPNAQYGENPPIYNKLYSQFAKGQLDMDLNDVLPYIKRVESVPDSAYREIFRAYAEDLKGKGKAAEALLDEIVERKRNLRNTYRTFYEELLEQRTGKKTAFKFLDEGTTAAKQTLSAVTMTEEAASKLTLAELKKIAKSNGVPNFGNMSKKQLITCISDPSKVEEMSNQVKAKLQAAAAKRKAAQATGASTPKKPAMGAIRSAEDTFDDLDNIPEKINGVNVRADFDALEGQNLSIRRIVVDGDDYIEINGKLTEDAWEDAKNRLRRRSMPSDFIYEEGHAIGDTMVFNSNKIVWSGDGMTFQVGNTRIEISEDNLGAQRGLFRIRALANGNVDTQQVVDTLRDAGLDFITYNPTQEAEELMKKARLLWQRNPGLASQYSQMKNKLATIDGYLAQAGIDPKDANKLVLEEVFDGYSTYMDYDALSAYQKAGLQYVWSGVRNRDSVVAMIKSGGMQSSKKRIANGFMGNGSSISSDIRTGGADSVFTRIATKGSCKDGAAYGYSYCGGDYQIIMKDTVMARTDWYAYTFDNFGDISDIGGNGSCLDFVKKMNKKYSSDNEIMFRNGIRLEDWAGIDTGSQLKKDSLIHALNQDGIYEINGKPLDKFIRVNSTVGKPLK